MLPMAELKNSSVLFCSGCEVNSSTECGGETEGPFQKTLVLVIVDAFSKQAYFIPCKQGPMAKMLAILFFAMQSEVIFIP